MKVEWLDLLGVPLTTARRLAVEWCGRGIKKAVKVWNAVEGSP